MPTEFCMSVMPNTAGWSWNAKSPVCQIMLMVAGRRHLHS